HRYGQSQANAIRHAPTYASNVRPWFCPAPRLRVRPLPHTRPDRPEPASRAVAPEPETITRWWHNYGHDNAHSMPSTPPHRCCARSAARCHQRFDRPCPALSRPRAATSRRPAAGQHRGLPPVQIRHSPSLAIAGLLAPILPQTAFLLIGIDDALHQGVAHHVTRG